MPIRFSTEAANADVLGDDAEPGGSRTARAAGADGAPRPRFTRSDQRWREPADAAKPGKDINAAGFVKDKDSTKP